MTQSNDDNKAATIVNFPFHYYQQFDADYQLEYPCQGYTGWQESNIDINVDRTALVVMHAWDLGTPDEYPGQHRATGELLHSYEVCKNVFPDLLKTVRNSQMPLFHVVGFGQYYQDYPGHKQTCELAGPEPEAPERMPSDPIADKICKFRHDNCFPGEHNQADITAAFKNLKFPKEAEPKGDEGIAQNAHQLFALCKKHNINHLIYVGFNINWCLLMSAGGMQDMSKRGLICSTIREGVVAVESKESAKGCLYKEEGLWRTSVAFGLVFDVESFKTTLKSIKSV